MAPHTGMLQDIHKLVPKQPDRHMEKRVPTAKRESVSSAMRPLLGIASLSEVLGVCSLLLTAAGWGRGGEVSLLSWERCIWCRRMPMQVLATAAGWEESRSITYAG